MAALEIKRNFKQSRQQVYNAWAQRENIEQWWGPKGFDTKAKTFELKEGGVFHYSFTQPGAPAQWGKFIFYAITPPHALSFSNSFSDEEANLTRAPFADAWPIKMLNHVILEENEKGTTITLTVKPMDATLEEEKTFDDNFDNMRAGFGGTFDRLEAFLAKQS